MYGTIPEAFENTPQHYSAAADQRRCYVLWTLLRLLSCAVTADALAILCLSAYCMVIDLGSRELDVVQLSFRLYGLALYTIAALCEVDWCECLRTSHLLQHWTWRGLFHVFLGLLSMNEYMQMKIAAAGVIGYLGALLIAMGILYTILVRRCYFIMIRFAYDHCP